MIEDKTSSHGCLGILIPEFPSQTHAFFWREITALRALGADVAILSTRRPAADACPHAFAADCIRETFYAMPPSALPVLLIALSSPLRLAAAVHYVAGLSETPILRRWKPLAMILCAAGVLRFARRRGIRHIHVHSCADAAHLIALCQLLGGPSYSLFLHGDLPVYGVDHPSKMRKAKFVMTAGRHLVASVVDRTGLAAARVIPTWMGVDVRQFTPAAVKTMIPRQLRILTVARLNAAKGHVHALAAIRQCVDKGLSITYDIVGAGPHEEQIRSRVLELSLQSRVTLHGSLGENEIRQLLQSADVFLLPSVGLGEAAPVVVMEAMACGVPVICSIIGSTPDMILDGVDGILVHQKDELGIARALERLALEPATRAAMGKKARERAEADFDCQRLAAQLAAHIGAWVLEGVDPVGRRGKP